MIRLPKFYMNPIVVKEFRSRMRGWRAFALLTGVLLLLAGSSYALYQVVLSTSRYSTTPLSPQVGQVLFFGLSYIVLLMSCFITPAVTAGAVSNEQEKQTYEMLLATPLRPARILNGKLFAALGYVFLLIFAAIPMASLVFIYGGVAPREMLKALIFCLCTTIMLGVVGIFLSAWTGRTTRATVLSYLFVLLLLVGPLVAYIMVGIIRQSEPPRWILILNPVSGLASALTSYSPVGGDMGFLGGLGWMLSGRWAMLNSGVVSTTKIPRPLYHYTLPAYGVLTLVLYLISTRLVRPTRRWRIRWREALLAAGVLLAFVGLTTGAFLLTAERYEWALEGVPAPTMVPVMPEASVRNVGVVVPPPEIKRLNTDLNETDEAVIYAAVIRQLYTVDHTFDQPPTLSTLYVLRSTDDSVGDPNVLQSNNVELPESLREKINLELISSADSLKIVWVDDRDEVPMDDTDGVIEGAIITLGNIHLQEDGSVQVSGSIYFASLASGGQTYILQVVNDIWEVVGNTGVSWMS